MKATEHIDKETIMQLVVDGVISNKVAARYFPELKESKDEEIRKGIIDFLWEEKIFLQEAHSSVENNPKYRFVMDAIAWLERRCEEKPVISGDALREGIAHFGITQYQIDNWLKKYVGVEKQGEQKPADKVEPKFKVGDWVIDKQGIKHQISNVVENVTCHTYGYDIVGGGYFNDNTEGVRLWNIQDAKDGDVLAVTMYPGGTWIGIFKEQNGCTFSSYCFVNTKGIFKRGAYNHGNGTAVHPASKEQRELLFQMMKEAGYEWDAKRRS